MFSDRVDAGRKLATHLAAYRGAPDTVVLGIPRGGVVVAAEVARDLCLPLDIVLAAKVAAPENPEFAVGALTEDGELLANRQAGYSREALAGIAGAAREKIAHQLADLRGGMPAQPLAGRTAIVVDDGLATGLTALAAVRYLRRLGVAKVILAVPVAAADSAAILQPEVDAFVAAEIPSFFSAVGQFYGSFGQTPDSEVRALLEDAASRRTWSL